uniref:Uncharacterized protein n=1 Tax=Oryza brachyantha TaxID=4533 RepID=J3M8F8_ORYBR
GLHNVDVHRPGARREGPVELVDEVADHGGDEVDAELRAGADAAAGAERQHPEVVALDIDGLLQEALRPELSGLLHSLGSRAIAHTFTITLAPLG